MENEFDGTLFFKGEGKKRKLFLKFTTRNEKTWENPIGENLLSTSLKEFAREEKGEAEKVVKLQEQGGRPIAVYLEGETVVNMAENMPVDYSKKSSSPSSDKAKFPKSETFESSQSKGENRNMSKDFHNPYNFVPAIPRNHIDGKINELGDREPSGHDRYISDKFSGKLSVKMKVETPLVALDTARVEMQGDHKKFPVRVGADGKPYINPTAVKGMLRSAYEAITNSRLSVFTKHEERLAFRSEVDIALSVIPARIEMHLGSLHIRKFADDKAPVIVRYRKHWHGETDKLEKDDTRTTRTVSGRAMKYASSTNLPQHGKPVWVKVSKRYKWERGTPTTRVIGTKIDDIQPRTIGAVAPTGFREGWVCITGANMDKKVYERVFVESASDTHIVLTNYHKKVWKELIANYQEIHKDEIKKRVGSPSDYLGNKPGQTAFSRHIYKPQDLELEDGTLCYLIEQGGIIKGLFPVMISRRLHEVSPDSLLDESLKPTTDINKLSPTDRVFGWVKQKGIGSYRGQVRFGSVVCKTDDAIQDFNNLPLNILGQPKPQQGRFYVAENPQGKAQVFQRNNEDAGYKKSENRGLRGRKVYPHHNLPDTYWITEEDWKSKEESDGDLTQTLLGGKYFREYIRPKGNERFNSQNRSIQGWVKPLTEFEFDIHFTNLSEVELGALVWLLQLPVEHFHRFGGGKPYGFGSVRLDLAKYQISKGSKLVNFYQSLDSKIDEIVKDETDEQKIKDFEETLETTFVKPFKDAVKDVYNQANFDDVSFIKAFKFGCTGFADKPTHYPRKQQMPNPKGEGFEWFVENNKIKNGNGYVLQDLANDDGLPYLD